MQEANAQVPTQDLISLAGTMGLPLTLMNPLKLSKSLVWLIVSKEVTSNLAILVYAECSAQQEAASIFPSESVLALTCLDQ